MRRLKLVREQEALNPYITVGAIVVVVIIVVLVALPWLNRDDNYGNDPDDPPEEAGPDAGEPDWQLKFSFKITFSIEEVDGEWEFDQAGAFVDALELEDYDGDPWELSIASVMPSEIDVHYKLRLHNGVSVYKTEGKVAAQKISLTSAYIQREAEDTRYFFFWEEQASSWSWSLIFWMNDVTEAEYGSFTITNGNLVEG